MKLHIAHEFDVDPDTFWTKIFFDPEFNQKLYVEALHFPEWKVLEERDAGAEVIRRVRVTPKQDAPAAVRKIVGDAASYTEEGTYDKAKKRYRFRIVPSAMADKFNSGGELWVEPLGPKKSRRVVDLNIEVKIFGLGGVVENFIGGSTRDSYEQAAVFTRQWIKDKGL